MTVGSMSMIVKNQQKPWVSFVSAWKYSILYLPFPVPTLFIGGIFIPLIFFLVLHYVRLIETPSNLLVGCNEIGRFKSFRTDPVSKLDSVESVKTNVLIQGAVQRARAWKKQSKKIHATNSYLICSQEKLKQWFMIFVVKLRHWKYIYDGLKSKKEVDVKVVNLDGRKIYLEKSRLRN